MKRDNRDKRKTNARDEQKLVDAIGKLQQAPLLADRDHRLLGSGEGDTEAICFPSSQEDIEKLRRHDSLSRQRTTNIIATSNTTSTTISHSNSIQHMCKDMEEGEKIKEQKMWCCCFRDKWALISSMCIALFITAIFVAMFMVNILDNNDSRRFNQHLELDQPTYSFFSTKTSYNTAYYHLNGSLYAMYQYNHRHPDNRDYNADPSKHRLPKIFSEKESMKTLDEKLVQEYGCKVRQLHFFGRHAARYPSADDMNFTLTHLANVQKRIDLSKTMSTSENSNHDHHVQPDPQHEQRVSVSELPNYNELNNHIIMNKDVNGTKENSTSSSQAQQSNFLANYKHWNSFMKAEMANLIMDSGALETEQIAKRLKILYPQMFDANLSKLEIGSSSRDRAAQTALFFSKHIDNLELTGCDKTSGDFLASSPAPAQQLADSDYLSARARSLDQSGCLKSFIKDHHQPNLEFHKQCDELKRSETIVDYKLNLGNLSKILSIADSVSRKLQLSEGQSLNLNETFAIYKACQYESAHSGGRSIWCHLFTEEELEFFEFRDDVEDFYNQAYGSEELYRSACPLTRQLMKSLLSDARASKDQAFFYFSHSRVIQRLLAASVDMKGDPKFQLNDIKNHLQSGTVAHERDWRTSLLTPFSANLAFTLYECPQSEKLEVETQSKIAKSLKMDDIKEEAQGVISHDLRHIIKTRVVVATLNEKPIQLDGCERSVCDLRDLEEDSKLNSEKRCRLHEICREHKIFI